MRFLYLYSLLSLHYVVTTFVFCLRPKAGVNRRPLLQKTGKDIRDQSVIFSGWRQYFQLPIIVGGRKGIGHAKTSASCYQKYTLSE